MAIHNPPSSIMPTGTTLTPPTQALPDTPAPKKTFGFPDVQRNQISAPSQTRHKLELLFSPPVSHPATPSIHLQSSTDCDYDADPAVPQSGEPEDEYTLSAYGDISLGEVIVPPLPAPTRSRSGPLQPRIPQPCLRLKVRRPPMPKSLPWLQHQPLVSPLPVDPTSSRTHGNKPVKNGGSSLEKLFDELLPHSPSIRLSPPGSPASQALSLPQETYEQKSGALQERNLPEEDGAAKLPQSPLAPAPRQDKPKSAAWRTRLPPRLPIPEWDV